MPHLTLSLLGPPHLERDGVPIKVRRRKAIALLAYLALTDPSGGHSRDSLATLLWPESDQVRARSVLRRTLSSLNKALGGDWLILDREHVALEREAGFWLDVDQFQALFTACKEHDHPQAELCPDCLAALAEAVELYHGDFMAGFTLRDSPDFDDWQSFQTEHLRRELQAALDKLVRGHGAQGEFEPAIAYAQRWLALDPLHESAHRHLMRLYTWSGNRPAALRQFEACAEILEDELGVPPMEETVQLYEAIKEDRLSAPAAEIKPTPPHVPTPFPPCPYRGLFAFREQDAPLFFGREIFTQRLIEAAQRQPLVALIGPSGSGKSSILFAGLLAHQRKEEDWISAAFRPGADPFRTLAATLVPILEPDISEVGRPAEVRQLASALGDQQLSLHALVVRILGTRPHASRLLLLADQFEELYTLCPEPELRRRFLDVLLEVVDAQGFRPQPAFTLVLTLRADFLGHVLAYRPFADALQGANLILGPMTREELGRAIQGPAERLGVTLETGLVERILAEVGDEPGSLPLLQFALTLLWERQTGGRLSHAAYEAVGQVRGALAGYADNVYAGLTEADREVARRVFVQLVRPGEGTEDTRRLATRAELDEEDWSLVQRLADARLTVTGRDASTGQETAEVAHEALIRSWGQLRAWMEVDRTFRIWQERLRAALHQWQTSGQDDGALLRGVPLAEAESWSAERGSNLSQAEASFIQASVALRERRQLEREREQAARERLRRRVTLGLTVGLIVALALTAVAGLQWRRAEQGQQVANEERLAALDARATSAAERDRADTQARVNLARQVATQALLYLDDQLDLALLLSAAAHHLADTYESRNSLVTTLVHKPWLARFLRGHTDQVRSVAFSPDGQTLASAGDDHVVILWDVSTGQPAGPALRGHEASVRSVAYSPDGQTLASGSADGTVILWDVDTRQPLGSAGGRLTGHTGGVQSASFSPDGQILASGGGDNTIIVWDVASGKPLGPPLAGHNDAVQSVAFSPNGRTLASGSSDGTIILWDVATRQPRGSPLVEHLDWVQSVAFSPDGQVLATGSKDRTVILWDVATRQPLGPPLTAHVADVRSVAFSPDGRVLASGSSDKTIILWDVTTRQPLDPVKGHFTDHTDWVQSVTFSSDGHTLASGGAEGTIILWDLASDDPLSQPLTGFTSTPYSMAFSPSGATLALGNRDGTVTLWDVSAALNTGVVQRQPLDPTRGSVASHADWVSAVTFSSDGRKLASGSADGTVLLWDVASQQSLTSPRAGHSDVVRSVAFSSDGVTLVSESGGEFIAWDVKTSQPIGPPVTDPHLSAAISPDGKTLALGTVEGSIALWNVATGQWLDPPFTGHEAGVSSVAFSSDGQTLASGSRDNKVMLWDVATRQPIGPPLTGHPSSPVSIVFSPDGRTLASHSYDFTIIVWDVVKGQPAGSPFTGRTPRRKAGSNIAFSPDSQIFASAGLAGGFILSDGATGRPLGPPLASGTDWVGVLAFSPDSKALFSLHVDGELVLSDVSVESWLAHACHRANRNLSRAEWEQFFGDEPYQVACPDLPVEP